MLLGSSTFTFPWAFSGSSSPWDLNDLLDWTTAHGLRALQIGDNFPLQEWPAVKWRAFLRRADRRGIRVEVGTRRATLDHLLPYISLASEAGSNFLRLIIDDGEIYRPDEGTIITTIRTLLPFLRAAGVILAIENHDRFTARDLERIIQETDPEWVGICLDTVNSLGADEGLSTVLSVLKPYVVNVHIKDYRTSRMPHKMGFVVEGCPAGAGRLDIPDLLNTLAATGRCRSATLEIWSTPLSNLSASRVREKEWAEQSIHYLRNIKKSPLKGLNHST